MKPEQVRPHQHPGVELLYVLTGKVELSIGEDCHELADGDSVYFDSGSEHGYRRIGSKRFTAIVVTLP